MTAKDDLRTTANSSGAVRVISVEQGEDPRDFTLVAFGGGHVADDDLHAHCTAELARYKAPKEYIVVENVKRLGNGKPDYRWAKTVATQQEAAL